MDKTQEQVSIQQENKSCPFSGADCIQDKCMLWVTTQVPTNLGVSKPVGTCVFLALLLKPPVMLMNPGSQPTMKIPMPGMPK